MCKLLSVEDVHPTVKDTTDSKGQLSVKYFCRDFNTRKVTDNTGDAWAEMSQSCMNGVWRNIWPDVLNFHGFDPGEVIGSSRCAIIYGNLMSYTK
jgi:hypothetical protein